MADEHKSQNSIDYWELSRKRRERKERERKEDEKSDQRRFLVGLLVFILISVCALSLVWDMNMIMPFVILILQMLFVLVIFIPLFLLILYKSNEKLWFASSIIFILMGFTMAYHLIYVGQELKPENPIVLVYKLSSTGYMGLSDPLDYPIQKDNFRGDAEGSPKEFIDYINDNNYSVNTVDYRNFTISCKPFDKIYEEGGEIVCNLNEMDSNLNVSMTSVRNLSNVMHYYSLQSTLIIPLIPRDFCIKPTLYLSPVNCSPNFLEGWNDKKEYFLKLDNSGRQTVIISRRWITDYSDSIYPKGYNYSTYDFSAIEYANQNLVVHSKDEALYLRQKDRERTQQFILAVFVLFAIPAAVYNLKKLWRDKEEKE